MFKINKIYSIRKFSVGVASVMIGLGFIVNTTKVNADETVSTIDTNIEKKLEDVSVINNEISINNETLEDNKLDIEVTEDKNTIQPRTISADETNTSQENIIKSDYIPTDENQKMYTVSIANSLGEDEIVNPSPKMAEEVFSEEEKLKEKVEDSEEIFNLYKKTFNQMHPRDREQVKGIKFSNPDEFSSPLVLGTTDSNKNIKINVQYANLKTNPLAYEVLFHEIGHTIDYGTYNYGTQLSFSRDEKVQPLLLKFKENYDNARKVEISPANYEIWAVMYGNHIHRTLGLPGAIRLDKELENEIDTYFEQLLRPLRTMTAKEVIEPQDDKFYEYQYNPNLNYLETKIIKESENSISSNKYLTYEEVKSTGLDNITELIGTKIIKERIGGIMEVNNIDPTSFVNVQVKRSYIKNGERYSEYDVQIKPFIPKNTSTGINYNLFNIFSSGNIEKIELSHKVDSEGNIETINKELEIVDNIDNFTNFNNQTLKVDNILQSDLISQYIYEYKEENVPVNSVYTLKVVDSQMSHYTITTKTEKIDDLEQDVYDILAVLNGYRELEKDQFFPNPFAILKGPDNILLDEDEGEIKYVDVITPINYLIKNYMRGPILTNPASEDMSLKPYNEQMPKNVAIPNNDVNDVLKDFSYDNNKYGNHYIWEKQIAAPDKEYIAAIKDDLFDYAFSKLPKLTTVQEKEEFKTIYIADESLEVGETRVDSEGIAGQNTIHYIPVLDRFGKEIGNERTLEEVIETKKSVNKVVRVGTKPSITNKIIEFKTVYEEDESLTKGEEREERQGVNGAVTITTTYTVNPETGELTMTKTENVTEPISRVVKVSSNNTDKTITKDDKDIEQKEEKPSKKVETEKDNTDNEIKIEKTEEKSVNKIKEDKSLTKNISSLKDDNIAVSTTKESTLPKTSEKSSLIYIVIGTLFLGIASIFNYKKRGN